MIQPPVDPTTTAEQNLLTASQRRVNMVWEVTQAGIALSVNATTLIVCGVLASRGDSSATTLLSSAFFLVIGFYFGRTNHARAGDSSAGSMNR